MKNKKGWYPGMYEGKTPEQVFSEYGTIDLKTSQVTWYKTPRSMRGIDPKTLALRKDGKLYKPLNNK